MRKLALTLALVAMAGIAAAQDPKPLAPEASTTQATAAAKTHEVEAEIVSFDTASKTLTIKGSPDNKMVPVDAKAVAMVKDLKSGDKVTLICRDNDKGEHQAVTGVKLPNKK
jgi:hypothetical protein